MQYISLKRYFHMNERKCNEIYMKRFESESCRRLGIDIHGSECFYIVTEEMVNLMTEIYSMNTWIERKLNSLILPYSAYSYLIMKSLIEEIRSSNQIEGIYSTRQELEEMMNMDSPQKYKRFYGMVSQYSKLTSEKFQPIESCSMIRKLYDDILLKDVVKENEQDAIDGIVFRKGDVEIHSGTKIVHKGVCGEKNIIDMMEKSLKILNHEHIPLLIRVAIFHYLFEYIHPFYNGNGRMGRFMSSGYLSTELIYYVHCIFLSHVIIIKKNTMMLLK